MSKEQRFTNSLIKETSPYLLQHAHNPVEWYGWGEEALTRAKKENKPILLSIGYSACHWCHVMEKESFEDEETAALMNRYFINIKVDREERPDLDQIYQNAVQFFIKRGGGWPLTMFLTPEQVPFYGGTYFPPEDRYNLPGFPRALEAVAKAYTDNHDEVIKNSTQALMGLSKMGKVYPKKDEIPQDLIKKSVEALAQFYNPAYGGFGGAPKFPSTMIHQLFLRFYESSRDESYLNKVLHTLHKMATGGIYDQLGGGFHRYSVDERWLVPHFEKMLYDNAQMVPLFLLGFQLSQNPFFKQIAAETLDYVLREMTSPEGGFYSTQDADSEGVEGKFFVWTLMEVNQILSPETSSVVCRYFDITQQGNFEGRTILNTPYELKKVAGEFNQPPEVIEKIIRDAKKTLFEKRETRIKPDRDEKILTSWNGLMISGLIEGYRVIGDETYLAAAVKGIQFLFKHLYQNEILLATYKDGTAKLNGYLDDYAFVTAALLDLYETTHQKETLEKAIVLTDTLLANFWDKEEGGFFFTGSHHEILINRPKSGQDHSIPSGNAVAARNLSRLYDHTEQKVYLDFAKVLFKIYAEQMEGNPFGFGSFLCAYDDNVRKNQVVLVGPNLEDINPWLDRLKEIYLPHTAIYPVTEKEVEGSGPLKTISEKRMVNGQVTAYFCENFTCSPPVTHWEDLKNLMTRKKNN
ncbi:MAG: thioredoxin domain-containing protein [Nitrospirae bacterium]|nr:thioredoxin domain-containing protein [Nitrospirota bacterium]MBI3351613.1 thioredoxin domain-containing protein [Nitrospirota bacterium]